ncbi:TPA: hydrolase [candidate division CPR2 bacterium]|uniref:Nudix hydrolase domain-containing protein n=1 Tax=candidate division CPR2 bacterium GW2011_GWC1_41_48 TaxID=1618344 RepID=A0A0G0WCK8_UNCC2|nr:MAG: hypothetical protein UT47_C0001G0192 [candidate division CPR2 bacterium GW2011_GWC2_39_35]KKR28526.1 MAG: hypothetical protein UT59_C0025G0013 [candidate division CPR2 bacterium GW2011_GWD1_39_7]KKR28709.1 MAG: hypothetical protein UT60_C0014G0020 [candidate division CPR2 bacterium GW2011_GWD2_39_7]KKS09787.1 MAG: hypothetical protein UU65_C0001G0192 [candidate division CPR2 bacterium GW2011_GWC1_41_48]OGB60991.1 MAG: hypothetical protein A2Y27_03460 [candidate division CPR2 bacterium G
MAEDLLEVLDENGNPTGEILPKKEVHQQGKWHRCTHIWLYNSKGEILLQKRSKIKDVHPGLLYVSGGGHIDAGETPEEGGIRELKEEIGLKANVEDLKFVYVRIVDAFVNNKKATYQNREFINVYLLKHDGSISNFKLQEEEVEKLELKPLEVFRMEINDPEKYKEYVQAKEYFEKVIDAALELAKAQ